MGVVYRARDTSVGRDVALKSFTTGTALPANTRRRFQKEATALARLSHPNVAILYEFIADQDRDWLVMEFVPGVSLDQKINGNPLRETDVVRLGIQLTTGLAALHQTGVLHCDIKPANIRIGPDGTLKIVDLGLAVLYASVAGTPQRDDSGRPPGIISLENIDHWWQKTEAEGVAACNASTREWQPPEQPDTLSVLTLAAGTLPYIAPEVLRGSMVSEKSDIYAAGAVLFEMATGRRIFHDLAKGPLVQAILYEEIPTPRRLNCAISRDLDDLIARCLAKDPASRVASAQELRAKLWLICRKQFPSLSEDSSITSWPDEAQVGARTYLRRAILTGSLGALFLLLSIGFFLSTFRLLLATWDSPGGWMLILLSFLVLVVTGVTLFESVRLFRVFARSRLR